jgi:PleD family two-component response regulator
MLQLAALVPVNCSGLTIEGKSIRPRFVPGELMKKVLVVDDSQSIRNEVANALVPVGFTVLEAPDGSEAFLRLAEHQTLASSFWTSTCRA